MECDVKMSRFWKNWKKMEAQATDEKLRELEGRYRARGFKMIDRGLARTALRNQEVNKRVVFFLICATFASGLFLGVMASQPETSEVVLVENNSEVDTKPGVVVYNDAGLPSCKSPSWLEQQEIASGKHYVRC